MKTDDLVKLALTACLSVILTGATAWLVFGQDKVGRTEVESMIANSLISTSTALDARITANAQASAELKGSITDLVKAQQELLVEQKVLIERVNTLVDRLSER